MLIFLIFSIITLSSYAQDKTIEKPNNEIKKIIIGISEKWTVLHAQPNGNSVCYAILYSEKQVGNQKKRNEQPYIMVHYFSAEKMRFSSYFGYKLYSGSSVNLSINSTQYQLNSIGEYAITSSSEQDHSIISNLQNSQELLIRGEGEKLQYSVDFYQTQGFQKAMEIMENHCGTTYNNSSFMKIVPSLQDIKEIEPPQEEKSTKDGSTKKDN